MKKFRTFVICLLVALCAVGCNSSIPTLTPDTSCWSDTSSEYAIKATYEKSVFTVNKVDAKTKTTIANGTLTYILEFDSSKNNMLLSADFSLTYNNDAPEVYRGTTDTITSKSWFVPKTLSPVESEKTVNLEKRTGIADLSYSLSTNYTEKTSTLDWKDDNRKDSTIKFSPGSAYDSEMMYYVVRAFELSSSSATFTVASLFDAHVNGAYEATPMFFAVSGESQTNLPADKFAPFTDAQASVMAKTVSLSIDSDFSGPPFTLKYSKTPFKVSDSRNNEKVLIYIRTDEYDVLNSVQTYYTEYNLTDYSVTKGA